MKAAMLKGLFIAAMFTVTSANAEVVSAELSFQLETSCVKQSESGSIELQTCSMTVASLEQFSQDKTKNEYVDSSEVAENMASPVSEPNTAALMVLGFGVLSMVAGARLKNS